MEKIILHIIPIVAFQQIFIYSLDPSNIGEKTNINPCTLLSTCGSCISSPMCGWCLQEDYKNQPRCNTPQNHLNKSCSLNEIVNPHSNMKTIENIELSDAGAVTGSATQLKPQHIKLTLRPKQPVTFTLSFRQAEDYPVDLYYLMDLTWSMKDHKAKLAQLANILAASMFNITKNFKLGFGSFIDKVVMPYASMVPARLENPCGEDFTCSPPYGFRNHLSLTNDISKFVDKVSNASLSANLDNAEGGFDAIMQVVVCKDHIKWRDRSRKIILFATDSIFHYAGDGLLGGIITPNDENCHLNDDGFYTQSLYQDYPSLSQINRKLVDNKINVIFAVPEQKTELYKILSSKIEASYTGKLLKDSSNIVHLIKDQYNKIRSKVILKNSSNEFVKIKYFSKCLGENLKETNVCEDMTVGTTVDFDITIELTSCPKNSSLWNSGIVISPIGLQESLQIDINMICECDCEKPENEIAKSENCSSAGTFECGICTCDSNHYGKECECDEIQHSKLYQCQQTNTSDLCSGRGECICGECDCYPGPGDEKIFGQYCQCDTFSCERDSEGKVCGGPSHGICCGKCICSDDWTGDDCDCTTDQSTCIASIDNSEPLVCSGHGDCVCGKCKCHNDEQGSYTGLYCEDCNTCEGHCNIIRDCVECTVFGSDSLQEEECMNCTYNIQTVAEVKVENKNEKMCVFKDNDGCSFTFKYAYNESNELYIFAESTKECPKPINVPLVVGIVAGGVFLIGLIAVLIVRFCIHLKDLRDYKKFQEEVDKLKWGQETNPLYKKAVSNYQNPMYNPKTN